MRAPAALGNISLLPAAFVLLLSGPARAASPLDTVSKDRIVDLHCHAAGIGAGGSGCFVSPGLRGSYKYRIYLRAFSVTSEDLAAQGDALVIRRIAESLETSNRVGKAVVLALDGAVDGRGRLDSSRTEFYVPNDFVARETAKYPRLLFGASVNPKRPDALDRLERWAAAGAVLVKWLPSIQLFDPADSSLVPFYLRLKELGLPLLTHTGDEHSFTWAVNAYCDPERLRLPLEMGVTVIAAHAGTPGENEGISNMERLLRMFPDHPRLYADVSSLTQINKLGYLGKLLRRREARGRLLYGTDMPLVNTLLVSPLYYMFVLPPIKTFNLMRVDNPWDRDVGLKLALGLPAEVFLRTGAVLGVGR